MSTDPAAPNAHGPGTPNAHGAGTPPAYTDQPDWSAYTRVAVIAAVAGWALYVIAGFLNLSNAHSDLERHDATSRFLVGYLSGFTFWLSLPVGAMALLMIHHLAKTSWGLLLTRPFQAATRTLPLLFVLWVPLAVSVWFGGEAPHAAPEGAAKEGAKEKEHGPALSPYWWSRSHEVEEMALKAGGAEPGNKRDQAVETGKLLFNRAIAAQHEEEEKELNEGRYGFLSAPAYVGVGVVLFLIWGAMIYFLNAWGKAASDSNDPRVVDRNLEKLSNVSGPGLIIYAITITAAATQWVMSVEPGWASTMFPVIFAVNQFLTCFAFCLALFLLWSSRPPFAGFMRPKFQLDMGTLMLAFTLFWSYTSFSQYMLVWIGNLPEEIPFFLKRSNYEGERSGWWYVSAALIALHFALPFLLLLFRNIKMHPARLRAVAAYLVVICAVDVIWWIAPAAPQHGFPAWLIDVGAVLGVGGIWGLFFISQLRRRPLFPDNQAFLLPEGHTHGHH